MSKTNGLTRTWYQAKTKPVGTKRTNTNQSAVLVNSLKTSVQGEIVSHGILPTSITQLIIREPINDPVVYVLHGELLCARLFNCHEDQGGEGVGWFGVFRLERSGEGRSGPVYELVRLGSGRRDLSRFLLYQPSVNFYSPYFHCRDGGILFGGMVRFWSELEVPDHGGKTACRIGCSVSNPFRWRGV